MYELNFQINNLDQDRMLDECISQTNRILEENHPDFWITKILLIEAEQIQYQTSFSEKQPIKWKSSNYSITSDSNLTAFLFKLGLETQLKCIHDIFIISDTTTEDSQSPTITIAGMDFHRCLCETHLLVNRNNEGAMSPSDQQPILSQNKSTFKKQLKAFWMGWLHPDKVKASKDLAESIQ